MFVFADRAVTAQILEDVLKLIAELRKHIWPNERTAPIAEYSITASLGKRPVMLMPPLTESQSPSPQPHQS